MDGVVVVVVFVDDDRLISTNLQMSIFLQNVPVTRNPGLRSTRIACRLYV